MTERDLLQAASKLTAGDIDHIRKHHKSSAKPSAPPPENAHKAESAQPEVAESESNRPENDHAQPDSHATPNVTSSTTPRTRGKNHANQTNHTKRSHIEHPWPLIGATIEADYFGEHYTALIIPATKNRKLKSGCMIRVLSGPADGTEHISMSGAMEAATEQQRKQQDLGRKGCLSGWDFWKWAGKEGTKS